MKKFLLVFLGICLFSLNAYSDEKVINEKISFKPFKCEQIQSEFIRTKSENSCLIIQKLENHYQVKSHEHSINTWNSPQLLKYVDNKDGNKIIAHTWNNVVEWGKQSDKQPFSHLVSISLENLDDLFKTDNLELKSNHLTLPLTARRMNVLDIDSDGNEEIVYLGNREDGRNRNSSWKDVNYIFDLNSNELKSFGSPHFSHDLMYFDFNQDGYYEIIDYFYGDQKPGAIEVCDMKTNKCHKAKKANNFIDIGFNHVLSTKKGAIIFGSCPGLGNTTFCWSKVTSKKNKLKFEKLDSYQFKEKPTDKANFLIWTGDINDKPGYWIEGSDKKVFKMADRAWISTAIDFNKDGNTDSIGVAKDVVCKRKDNSKPFDRGKDCKTEEFLYVFKNNDDKSFEKHQVMPVSLNGSFRIETADINKDGTDDLYGFKEDWFNPWIDCKKQVSAMYFNQDNKSFEQASKSFNKENFGLYGCERASNFFKHNNNYYRLFVTIPSIDSKFAYLGIEKY